MQFAENDSGTLVGGDLEAVVHYTTLTLPFSSILLEATPDEGSPHLAAFREAPFFLFLLISLLYFLSLHTISFLLIVPFFTLILDPGHQSFS